MEQERRAQRNRAAAIRKGDHGPYTALRWVSTLFKSAAVFLAVAVLAESIAGVRADGWSALPLMLGEVARVAVMTVLLWAGGDLVRLLLQIGRDLRAERVLLARIAHRAQSSPLMATAPTVGDDLLPEGAAERRARGSGVLEVERPDGESIVPEWGRGAAADPGGESGEPGEAAA
jgi:hypothetical protein